MKRCKVFYMDLLCYMPWYNRYLIEHIRAINPDTTLGSITFHLDKGHYARSGLINDPGFLDIVARLGIRNKKVRSVLKLLEYVINLSALLVRFAFSRPDIVHIQWLPCITKASFELWFINMLKKMGIKVILTVHNVLPQDTGERYRAAFKKAYDAMDALVCLTVHAKDRLVEEFSVPADKIWVTYHGPIFHDKTCIPIDEARSRFGYSENQTVVLFSGTVKPYKGVEFLLEAWRKVVQECPGSLLVISGSGEKPFIDKINRLIRSHGIEGSVRTNFRFVSPEELAAYHRSADILVYPYKDITQSGALITGMVFGKPVIATAVGGLKEIIQDGRNGLLVEYGDVQGFADAVINLIRSPKERARLGEAARADVNSKYSWQTVAQKTVDCYRALLDGVYCGY